VLEFSPTRLAIGGSLLFEDSDFCGHLWIVKRSDHSLVSDAGAVGDEDIECDNVSFAPKSVLWVM
jgi:hypothetical protein